jgi:hypothetical protein
MYGFSGSTAFNQSICRPNTCYQMVSLTVTANPLVLFVWPHIRGRAPFHRLVTPDGGYLAVYSSSVQYICSIHTVAVYTKLGSNGHNYLCCFCGGLVAFSHLPVPVQCSAVQCSAVQCSAVQCSAVQCSAVKYSTVHCSAVLHIKVQYSAVQCSAVQCSTLQCSAQGRAMLSE